MSRDPHNHDNPWKNAPPWAIDLRELCVINLLRQETLIEMVRIASGELSAENQRRVDELYDKATAMKKKIDAALSAT